MRNLIGRFIIGVGVAVTAAPAVMAESLADALAYGYESSGLLEQNRALLRAADEDVAQAVSTLRPVIEWSAQATAREPRAAGTDLVTSSATLSASLLLYDGGQNRLAIDAQKALVLGTRESLRNVEQQVLLRVVEAYLEVRRAQAFVGLSENNVRLITQELRAANDRFEVGEVTRTDVSLAEARLAGSRSLLASRQGDLTQARAEYRAAVGREPGALAPAPEARIPGSLAEAQAIARRTHPSLRQAQHSVTAAELNIGRAEAAKRPQLSLGGSVSVDDNFDDSEQISLTVGAPIYAGGRISSQVRQAQAQRDAARGNMIETARRIDQNVANAYSFLSVAKASIEASTRQVSAAQIAFDGLREEATLGARTTLDVQDSEQDLLDARATLVSSQIDETLATYTILAASGLLTAEQLGLAVQVYDPAAYYNLVRNAPSVASSQGQALDRVLEAIGR